MWDLCLSSRTIRAWRLAVAIAAITAAVSVAAAPITGTAESSHFSSVAVSAVVVRPLEISYRTDAAGNTLLQISGTSELSIIRASDEVRILADGSLLIPSSNGSRIVTITVEY